MRRSKGPGKQHPKSYEKLRKVTAPRDPKPLFFRESRIFDTYSEHEDMVAAGIHPDVRGGMPHIRFDATYQVARVKGAFSRISANGIGGEKGGVFSRKPHF